MISTNVPAHLDTNTSFWTAPFVVFLDGKLLRQILQAATSFVLILAHIGKVMSVSGSPVESSHFFEYISTCIISVTQQTTHLARPCRLVHGARRSFGLHAAGV